MKRLALAQASIAARRFCKNAATTAKEKSAAERAQSSTKTRCGWRIRMSFMKNWKFCTLRG